MKYEDLEIEFDKVLGVGAFGNVYKVRNKLQRARTVLSRHVKPPPFCHVVRVTEDVLYIVLFLHVHFPYNHMMTQGKLWGTDVAIKEMLNVEVDEIKRLILREVFMLK